MTIADLKALIRMNLSGLGRDPYVKLPAKRAALEAQLKLLEIERKARGLMKT